MMVIGALLLSCLLLDSVSSTPLFPGVGVAIGMGVASSDSSHGVQVDRPRPMATPTSSQPIREQKSQALLSHQSVFDILSTQKVSDGFNWVSSDLQDQTSAQILLGPGPDSEPGEETGDQDQVSSVSSTDLRVGPDPQKVYSVQEVQQGTRSHPGPGEVLGSSPSSDGSDQNDSSAPTTRSSSDRTLLVPQSRNELDSSEDWTRTDDGANPVLGSSAQDSAATTQKMLKGTLSRSRTWTRSRRWTRTFSLVDVSLTADSSEESWESAGPQQVVGPDCRVMGPEVRSSSEEVQPEVRSSSEEVQEILVLSSFNPPASFSAPTPQPGSRRSTATSPPISTTATSLPTSTTATSLPTSTTATSLPTSTTATSLPTSTTATSPPTSTTATSPPTSTTATSLPTSTTATSPPTSTTATNPPTSTTATSPPTSTTATSLPTSTTATNPPTSTTATSLPTSTTATNPPTSTTATSPPTSSVATTAANNATAPIKVANSEESVAPPPRPPRRRKPYRFGSLGPISYSRSNHPVAMEMVSKDLSPSLCTNLRETSAARLCHDKKRFFNQLRDSFVRQQPAANRHGSRTPRLSIAVVANDSSSEETNS